MPWWVPLIFVFIAVTGGTMTLLSAAISAFEIRARRLAQLKEGRPIRPDITPSVSKERVQIDPAPMLTGVLQKSAMGKQLQLSILRAGLVWRPSEFVTISAFGLLLGYLIGWFAGHGSVPLAIVTALVGAGLPYVFVKVKQGQRQARMTAQIPDMLDILSSSLRSGHSFLSGVQIVVTQMQPPLSEEFERVLQEVRFGASLHNALAELVQRTENYDMELIISAVQTQLAVGGNLAEILDKIGSMIRDRVRLAGEIGAATAEGRFSAMILVGMPFLLAFLVNSISPGYLLPLVTDTYGQIMLGAAVVLMTVGVLIIRSMLNIEL